MPAGPHYTYGQLQSIWLAAAKGTKYATAAWARLMAAIGMAESSGYADAVNATDNGGRQSSYGIWQISTGTHNAPSPTWNDPTQNALLAINKLDTQGLSAWGTFTSGAYKQFMSGAGPANVPADTGPGTTATDTSAGGINWNPVSWAEAPIKGLENLGSWPLHFAEGEVKQAESVGTGLTDMVNTLGGLVKTFSKIGQLFALLFQPQLWVRVGAFFLAILALGGSIYFFVTSLKASDA